ncbi:hypothetical protein AB3X91_16025 [Paraburkholderia sp. BR14263]|uniref:hypothetical protein n=1 Tax=unclassified Paraburkholderia TaxID=2615204 RepID=UPI0034CED5DD
MNDMVESPFGSARREVSETAGARQDQSRELADMQVNYLMAQQYPRDQVKAMDRILNAFTRPSLAEKSQYEFARGGTEIRGPSIKAMEAIACEWKNIDASWRERSRGVDARGIPYSELEAFAVDLEGRVRKRIGFIVPHWRDTRQGGYALKDERDIYELCANQAQRRVRACLEAIIPGDVVDAAMAQADATLKAKADTTPESIAKMLDAFAPFRVTKEQIEKRIQRRLDSITPAQMVSLKRIYASLRDEMSEPSEWFEAVDAPAAAAPAADAAAAGSRTENVKSSMRAGAKKKDAPAADKAKKERVDTAPQGTGAPTVTCAEVAAALNEADSRDKLDEAADFIQYVKEPAQRDELHDLYHDRTAEF